MFRFVFFIIILPYTIFGIWNTSFNMFLKSLSNPAARFLNRLIFFSYRGFDSDMDVMFFFTYIYDFILWIFS